MAWSAVHHIFTSWYGAFSSSLCEAYKLLRVDFVPLKNSRRVNLNRMSCFIEAQYDGSNSCFRIGFNRHRHYPCCVSRRQPKSWNQGWGRPFDWTDTNSLWYGPAVCEITHCSLDHTYAYHVLAFNFFLLGEVVGNHMCRVQKWGRVIRLP
jgi:hypothetical protein